MVWIKAVIPKEDYLVEVQLDNGSGIMLNMKSRLGAVRFGMLADRELFKNVTTDGKQILWEDQVEISVSEVFQLAQK